tara:strand:+ start:445 stop:2178 length:1734 start_codon:yes stop_codon:yes gene_type:complete
MTKYEVLLIQNVNHQLKDLLEYINVFKGHKGIKDYIPLVHASIIPFDFTNISPQNLGMYGVYSDIKATYYAITRKAMQSVDFDALDVCITKYRADSKFDHNIFLSKQKFIERIKTLWPELTYQESNKKQIECLYVIYHLASASPITPKWQKNIMEFLAKALYFPLMSLGVPVNRKEEVANMVMNVKYERIGSFHRPDGSLPVHIFNHMVNPFIDPQFIASSQTAILSRGEFSKIASQYSTYQLRVNILRCGEIKCISSNGDKILIGYKNGKLLVFDSSLLIKKFEKSILWKSIDNIAVSECGKYSAIWSGYSNDAISIFDIEKMTVIKKVAFAGILWRTFSAAALSVLDGTADDMTFRRQQTAGKSNFLMFFNEEYLILKVVIGTDRSSITEFRALNINTGNILDGYEQFLADNEDALVAEKLNRDKIVLGTSRGRLIIWDPINPAENRIIDTLKNSAILCISISPTGRVVTGRDDSSIIIYDLSGQGEQTNLLQNQVEMGNAVSLTFLADGNLLVLFRNHATIICVDNRSFASIQTLNGLSNSIQFRSQRVKVCVSSNADILLYDTDSVDQLKFQH